MISVPKYRSNFDAQHFFFISVTENNAKCWCKIHFKFYALCYLDYTCLRIKNNP